MTTGMNKGGIILLNKPAGETSFQSLGCVKRALGTRKVGHTGTLDKFATGLLIILTGKFTKLNSLITGMDKVYEAEFTFGSETDSLDPEGDVIAEAPIPDENLVRNTMLQFLGKQEQTPPLYSAVHINGERAHKLARKGIDAVVPSRPIEIYSFDFVSWVQGKLNVRVHCSKGTYIRSLARDLGKACGSRAYVTRLNRSCVGPFSLEESVDPGSFSGEKDFYDWKTFFSKLPDTRILEVKNDVLPLIANGVPFKKEFLRDGKAEFAGMNVLIDGDSSIIAVLSARDSRLRYMINFS